MTASYVCRYSVNHSNVHFIISLDGSIWHFKFPKVVQAHALGEVGVLGTLLLRLYSGAILPIFIEIGSYLTEKEQKISWHIFLRQGVCIILMVYCLCFIYIYLVNSSV